ncbi:hypothetical protein QBC42DRAFT_213158 [Cladorrhinum samala]|uniref:Uncharacterized protein n=1 Tax=Cladorrhinum samala TaxID=585594 RepID=A0AAV9HB01_9PEZI|nr:hypothetical protein QBC42DRAFT_213158 [Cladorrhinum samala]
MAPAQQSTWHQQQQARSKVSINVLAPDHYQALDRAIRNVLATDLALTSVAELLDGLPLLGTLSETNYTFVHRLHPIRKHKDLCDGALDQAAAFRDAFDPTVLQFDSSVMQAFQNAEPGSREFKMRLVELVAIAVHHAAVLLHQLKPKLHTDAEIHSITWWRPEPRWEAVGTKGRKVLVPTTDPKPTWFFHPFYMDHEQYPHGLADVAAYWAEDRIFGGIVLFDRGQSGTECNDVYFHSARLETTDRIWRLLDSQFDDLISYLLSESGSPRHPPFPIQASRHNRHRFDDWDAIAMHHIFRDPWERKFPLTKPNNGRDVITECDYPEQGDMLDRLDVLAEATPDEGGDSPFCPSPYRTPRAGSPVLDDMRPQPESRGSPLGRNTPSLGSPSPAREDLTDGESEVRRHYDEVETLRGETISIRDEIATSADANKISSSSPKTSTLS